MSPKPPSHHASIHHRIKSGHYSLNCGQSASCDHCFHSTSGHGQDFQAKIGPSYTHSNISTQSADSIIKSTEFATTYRKGVLLGEQPPPFPPSQSCSHYVHTALSQQNQLVQLSTSVMFSSVGTLSCAVSSPQGERQWFVDKRYLEYAERNTCSCFSYIVCAFSNPFNRNSMGIVLEVIIMTTDAKLGNQ